MKIPAEKEFQIKKAILISIEKEESPAKLADFFGVSKSLIYKYRRELCYKGFIRKNENNVYVITHNKFSIKPKQPESGKLDLDSNIDNLETQHNTPENKNNKQKLEKSQVQLNSKIKIQDHLKQDIKLQQKQKSVKQNKSILKNIISKFKKII
ncbi:MAG: hypothetical protein Kow0076_3030 [Francisella sp.]